MKSRVLKLLAVSLLLGGLLNLLFTAQMNWKYQGDCSDAKVRVVLTSNIRSVACSGLEYGFPFKFIESQPKVDINPLTDDRSSPVLLGVTSTTEIDKLKLVLNILLWSAVSLVVLLAFSYRKQAKE